MNTRPIPKLPDTAPRGKVFVVTALSHVAGMGIASMNAHRGTTLADAQRCAASIDWRLTPTVSLVLAKDRAPRGPAPTQARYA